MGYAKNKDEVRLSPLSKKHSNYLLRCRENYINIAEGAYRAGKSITHILSFAEYLETCPDKLHLVSGYSASSARLNIADGNGFGLNYLFKGRCKAGKYEGNECLKIKTKTGEKVVIFVGGGNSDSYKKIQGQSFGSWLSVEVANLYIGNEPDKNFINMALSRLTQSMKPKVWWDLNPTYDTHDIYTKYIDVYDEKARQGEVVGGYNYEKFTLFDNRSLSEEQIALALNNFGDESSVLYQRGVLGNRAVAEGVIFSDVALNEKPYIVGEDYFKGKSTSVINIGVDFGGNSSGHYFTATWVDYNISEVVIIGNMYVPLGKSNGGVSNLKKPFKEFLLKVTALCRKLGFGGIDAVFADSAEQVLIQELRNVIYELDFDIVVNNSIKNAVKNRIDCKTKLINSGRWHILDDCVKSEESNILLSTKRQVWDSKEGHEDERLDNNNSFVNDGADSEEYSWECYLKHLSQF